MDFITYLLFVIIVGSLIGILFVIFYNKIQTELLRLKQTESELDESLRSKYDLLNNMCEIIKYDTDEFTRLKNEDLSSFEFSRDLKELEKVIENNLKETKKGKKGNNLDEKNTELKNLNIKLRAQEKYYNEIITSYNNLVKKFPSNIVGKILKLDEKKYFDNKDLNDEVENDFKV